MLARDPVGYASLCRAISLAHLRGGTKGHPVYDLDELTDLAQGHWVVLTGCRKGSVRAALGAGRSPAGREEAGRALAGLVDRFGRDNVVVELTYGPGTRWTTTATPRWPTSSRRLTCRWWQRRAPSITHPREVLWQRFWQVFGPA